MGIADRVRSENGRPAEFLYLIKSTEVSYHTVFLTHANNGWVDRFSRRGYHLYYVLVYLWLMPHRSLWAQPLQNCILFPLRTVWVHEYAARSTKLPQYFPKGSRCDIIGFLMAVPIGVPGRRYCLLPMDQWEPRACWNSPRTCKRSQSHDPPEEEILSRSRLTISVT